MSRSTKKTSIYKTIYKGSKKRANKRVRRFISEIINGNWFKKITNPWTITDQNSYIDKNNPFYEKCKRK